MAQRGLSGLRRVLSREGRPVLVPIIMSALIPVLLFGGWISYRAATDARAAARQAAREVVDRVVERATAELQAEVQVAETLALSASLDKPDLEAFYREASRLKEARQLWHTIELDDTEGQQLVNLLRPLGAQLGPTADLDSLQRAVRTKRSTVAGIGPVGPVSGRRLVTIRVPVL